MRFRTLEAIPWGDGRMLCLKRDVRCTVDGQSTRTKQHLPPIRSYSVNKRSSISKGMRGPGPRHHGKQQYTKYDPYPHCTKTKTLTGRQASARTHPGPPGPPPRPLATWPPPTPRTPPSRHRRRARFACVPSPEEWRREWPAAPVTSLSS